MPNLAELCRAVEGELRGSGDVDISGVGSLEGAGEDDIAPIDSERFLNAAADSRAGAFLVSRRIEPELDRPCIYADAPLVALNRVIERLGLVTPPPPPGVHPTAVIDGTATVPDSCSVGACVVIGPLARIGAGTILQANVVIEGGVAMGERCVVEAGAVLHEGAVLGNRVRIGANAVISRQGFGYTAGPAGPERLHHVGRVVLEDDVHVGAGTTIDRARYDETRIGRSSALDNLVHVGHNCTIGERTYVAAQAGLSGNAHIGSDCEIGGQVGVGNRCGTGDRCRVAGKSGLIRMWGDDKVLMWYPAHERSEALRMLATLRRLSRPTS